MSKTKINKQKMRKLKVTQKLRKDRDSLQEEKSIIKLEKEYYKELQKHENEESEKLTDDEVREKLLHNHKILDALEEEYLKDKADKAQLNQELEEQGAKTPKEKVEILKEMGQEIYKEYMKIQEEKETKQ